MAGTNAEAQSICISREREKKTPNIQTIQYISSSYLHSFLFSFFLPHRFEICKALCSISCRHISPMRCGLGKIAEHVGSVNNNTRKRERGKRANDVQRRANRSGKKEGASFRICWIFPFKESVFASPSAKHRFVKKKKDGRDRNTQ